MLNPNSFAAWDSMQLPVGTFYGSVYHFGNFDQCLQVPWQSYPELRTQYCLVDVKLAALNEYDGELIHPYDKADRYIGVSRIAFIFHLLRPSVYQRVGEKWLRLRKIQGVSYLYAKFHAIASSRFSVK